MKYFNIKFDKYQDGWYNLGIDLIYHDNHFDIVFSLVFWYLEITIGNDNPAENKWI